MVTSAAVAPDYKDSPRSKLTKIKQTAWSRGMAIAKVSMSAGAKAAGHAMGNLFAAEADKPERLKAMLMAQAGLLARELGQLKGSLMKVGQMLSMYGEHFLPPEVNGLLKSLQSQSPPLAWPEIQKALVRELGDKLAELEVEPEPLASASLGQVHLATLKRDGTRIALKIQYPGVDQAIESDIKALRQLLSLSKLIPKGPAFDELFREVQQMLHQEVDYSQELAHTQDFKQKLAHDPRYIVARTYPEFSTRRVIATHFEPGVALDGPEVRALSQERRDALARAALELYFTELFTLKQMQTDPHFGNYRVRLSEGSGPDRLVLLDFGAVRKFPDTFLEPYYQMLRGAFGKRKSDLWDGGRKLGFIQPGDSPELLEHFAELCMLIAEPFHTPAYDWRASDLPKRAAALGGRMAFEFKLRAPPREVVFLDRKMGGVFILMSTLGARIDAGASLEPYLGRFSGASS